MLLIPTRCGVNGPIPYPVHGSILSAASLLAVAEHKPLRSKTDDQRAKESSAPKFILYIQG